MGPWDWFWAGMGRLGRVRSVPCLPLGVSGRSAFRSGVLQLLGGAAVFSPVLCALVYETASRLPVSEEPCVTASARRARDLDDGPCPQTRGPRPAGLSALAEAPERASVSAGTCSPASQSRPPAPPPPALLPSDVFMSPSFIAPLSSFHGQISSHLFGVDECLVHDSS